MSINDDAEMTSQATPGTASMPLSGSLRAHLIKGAAGSFILQVGFAGFAFLNAIILARVLGPKGYGAFANAMAWVSLLTIPATFGFGILLVRDTAIYRSQGQWSLLKGLLRFSNNFVLILSVFLSLSAAVVANYLFAAPDQAMMRHTIWIALGMLPVLALYNLREATTRGLEYVIRARLPGMLVRPGLLLAGVICLYYFWPNHLEPSTAMAVNVAAGVTALGLGIFFLRKLLPPEVKTATPEYTPRPWLKAAFPMLVYGGAQIVLGQTDIVMLGAMRGAHDVGLYAVANRLAFLLIYVMMASNMILMPVMARLYANREIKRLQKILTQVVRLSFFLVLPFGIGLIFFGQKILNIFGPEFINAQPALIVLAIGRIIDLFVGVGTGILLLTVAGQEKAVAIIFLFVTLINLLLNLMLIPSYGTTGAAMASMTSLLTAKITIAIKSNTVTNISPTVLGGGA